MSQYEIPLDCRYTREDEWVRAEGDQVFIGITDYAQQQLGDVVFLELPEPGEEISEGEPFGVIESVKAVSDLYAPISGEVLEVNTALEDNPELVNERCYQDGWILCVEPSEPDSLESLMDPAEYQTYVEERAEAPNDDD